MFQEVKLRVDVKDFVPRSKEFPICDEFTYKEVTGVIDRTKCLKTAGREFGINAEVYK